MSIVKKFKKGDRVVVTENGKYTRVGQTGRVTDTKLITARKNMFWWYAVKLDNPISGSAPSYMFRDDSIKKI